jgi:AraC family transcriptional regulator, transcriptional activator of pobA
MSRQTSVPEIVLERLLEGGPQTHGELLATRHYRQYVFLYKGNGLAHFDGRRERLTPGSTLSIPAQSTCELQFAKSADGIWFAVLEEFLTSRVVPAIPAMTKPHSQFWNMYYTVSLRRELTGANQRTARQKVFRDLLSARDRLGMESDPIVVGYMQLILFAPSRNEMASRPTSSPGLHRVADNELVLAFRQLIEKHHRDHWNCDGYCKILGVTQRRLLTASKHVTGKFPKTLIHESVMREAHASLIYSSKSISEIAYALGFPSATYFSHFYKRNAGVSPRRALKRLGRSEKL